MLKHNDKKERITFTSEDLAVPEVHVGHIQREIAEENPAGEVLYDTVAVPEFHPGHDKHKEEK